MWKLSGLVTILILLANSLAIEIPSDLQEFIDDLHDLCLHKSGITNEEHKNYNIANQDPKMMCYMKCLMLESKWMNENGDIQYDFIIENAHPNVKDILVKALNKCRDIPATNDLCEKSYHFNECMYRADQKNWFFV